MTTVEVLQGSAGCMPSGIQDSIKTLGTDRDSNKELWLFYDRIPEAFWFTQFIGRSMRNCRYLPARKLTGGADPVPIGRILNVGDADDTKTDQALGAQDEGLTAEDIESRIVLPIDNDSWLEYKTETEKRAAELLDQFDLSAYSQRGSELLTVAGHAYLVGLVETVKEDELLPNEMPIRPSPDDDAPDILEWRVFSTEELTRDKRTKRWRLKSMDRDLHRATYVLPIRDEHPNNTAKVKSAYMAARDALRRVCVYQAALQSVADARLAMRGLLLISAEWRIPAPEGWDEAKDGKWNFEQWLHNAIVAPLTNPGLSSAAAPLVVSVPFEFLKDGFLFVDFFTKHDEHLLERIEHDLGRVAIAWDAPTPLMTTDGLQNTNHWNLWAIQESADVTTWRPMGSKLATPLTRYIKHQLTVEGFDSEEIDQLCVVADTSEIMSRANRFNEATTLHERGLLSDESTVLESGFALDQMPSEQESLESFMRQTALRTTNGNLQEVVLKALGIIDVDVSITDEAGGAPAEPDTETEDGPPGSELLASALGLLRDPETDPLPVMGALLSTVALAESAAVEGVRRIGNYLRHQVPKSERTDIEGMDPWEIAPALGRETTETMLNGHDWDQWDVMTFHRLRTVCSDRFGDDTADMVASAVRGAVFARLHDDDLGHGPVVNPVSILEMVGEAELALAR